LRANASVCRQRKDRERNSGPDLALLEHMAKDDLASRLAVILHPARRNAGN
jgi:hypothetical protein